MPRIHVNLEGLGPGCRGLFPTSPAPCSFGVAAFNILLAPSAQDQPGHSFIGPSRGPTKESPWQK